MYARPGPSRTIRSDRWRASIPATAPRSVRSTRAAAAGDSPSSARLARAAGPGRTSPAGQRGEPGEERARLEVVLGRGPRDVRAAPDEPEAGAPGSRCAARAATARRRRSAGRGGPEHVTARHSSAASPTHAWSPERSGPRRPRWQVVGEVQRAVRMLQPLRADRRAARPRHRAPGGSADRPPSPPSRRSRHARQCRSPPAISAGDDV